MIKTHTLSLTVFLVFILVTISPLKAQRIKDYNTLGWFSSFNTFHFNKKTSLWLEAQWRRDNMITDWMQFLTRTGIQYHFNKDLSVMAGYAYALTYSYGDYPSGPFSVPEHRIFEQLSWNDNIGKIGLNHRFRLEQRFLGKVNQTGKEYELLDYNFMNRIRYQMRASIPLNKKTLQNNTWYAAGFDEIFIGFGKNVNQNIFDQNRIGLLLGYQFHNNARIEGGYFNQIIQQGSRVNGKEVFQYNNGIMVSLYTTFNN